MFNTPADQAIDLGDFSTNKHIVNTFLQEHPAGVYGLLESMAMLLPTGDVKALIEAQLPECPATVATHKADGTPVRIAMDEHREYLATVH